MSVGKTQGPPKKNWALVMDCLFLNEPSLYFLARKDFPHPSLKGMIANLARQKFNETLTHRSNANQIR